MNPISRLAGGVLAALALTSCATPVSVTSYVERGVDWSLYRTYMWAAADAQPTGDPRIDGNEIIHERMQTDVDGWLKRRGFTKVSAGADVAVRYRVEFTENVEQAAADPVTGYCPDNDCGAYVVQSGTLVFELADARTNRPLWRGWATGTVAGVVDDQERLEETIDDVVARVFERLPARED
jgi:hypothetical protein